MVKPQIYMVEFDVQHTSTLSFSLDHGMWNNFG